MTLKQRKRIEEMIAWHKRRQVECIGLPAEAHHVAKASALEAALRTCDLFNKACRLVQIMQDGLQIIADGGDETAKETLRAARIEAAS